MRSIGSVWRLIATAFTVAAIVHAYRTKQSHGTYFHVPFEFRFPTVGRLRQRLWNRHDHRIFTPSVLGIGWSVNFYQVGLRLGLVETPDDYEENGVRPIG
jgi:hypothetical protein